MAQPKGKRQSYTVMGVTFALDEARLEAVSDDFRLLDDLTSRDGMEQFRGVATVLKAALGDDYDRVLDELQGDDQTLPVKRVIQFFTEMSVAVAALKN